MIDLLSSAGALILVAVTFLAGVAVTIANFDAAQRLIARSLGYVTWLAGPVLRWRLRADVEGHVNQYLDRRLFADPDGVDSPRLKLRWVRDPKDPILHKDGRLIVRIRDDADPSRNYLNAVASALPRILVPCARPYLNKEFVEAVDLHVLKRLANSVSVDAERAFASEFLGPKMSAFPGLHKHLHRLDQIDRGGLFTAMLIQEMVYLDALVSVQTPHADLQDEVVEFAEWLCYHATREPHDESGKMTFIRPHIKVAVILLSKTETAKHGAAPYVRRMLLDVAIGARHVYLLPVTPHHGSLCDEVVVALAAERRVKLANRVNILRRGDGAPEILPLVLFHAQDLFAEEGVADRLLTEIGVAPTLVIDGTVTAVGDGRAVVDIDGLGAIIRSRDLAPGYRGSTSDFLQVGERRQFMVLEADPSTLTVHLGLRQLEPSPEWDSLDFTEGDQVACTVHSIKKSRIIVQLDESGIYGVISNRDWSYRDPDNHPYIHPEPGLTTSATVLAVDDDWEGVRLSRRDTEVPDWEEIWTEYPVDTSVRVTVCKLGGEGVYCEIRPGVGGWIPSPVLRKAGLEFADWQETMQLGQRLDVVVTKIQANNNRFTFAL